MDEQELMESLATPGAPIDIHILDSTVQIMKNTDVLSEKARLIIEHFSNRPDSWKVANDVLNSVQCSYSTKFIVLRILRNTIRNSWSGFDQPTKDSIIDFILPQSVNLANINADQSCINMAVEVIVEILKFEWPNDYPSFIDDLLQSMSESNSGFKNGMNILQELAHDINDYNNCGITSERSIDMTDAFEQQFPQVFDVITSIFTNQDTDILSDSSVVHSILKAIKSFVPLVDIRFFISTQFFSILCENYLNDPEYIFDVIDIFSEISSASMPTEFRELIPDVFKSVIQGLSSILEINSTSDEEGKSPFSSLSKNLIQILTFSLTSFLTRFSNILINIEDGIFVKTAIEWLIQITEISTDDSLFTCLEFWMKVTRSCHSEYFKQETNDGFNYLPFYEPFFPELEQILVSKIIVPFEVSQREDEDGTEWEEVIETTSPSYQPMKTSLCFLTNMNDSDVFSILMDLSSSSTSDEDFDALDLFAFKASCLTTPICDEFISSSFEVLSGSLNEISRSYLWFVSQHSRFISTRPDILQDVIQNIIEFLLDDEARIFALFALRKLFESTQLKDVFIQYDLLEPFMNGLISNELLVDEFVIDQAATIISHTINKGNEGNPVNDEEKEKLLSLLLDQNDSKWSELSANLDTSNIAPIISTMRVYSKSAAILGPLFISPIMKLLPSFVDSYKFFSADVSASTNEEAIIIRQVKTSIVVAIESFANKLPSCPPVVSEFVISQCFPMSEFFCNSIKETRDPSLLRLFGLFCEKFGDFLLPQMDDLFQLVFLPIVSDVLNSDDSKSCFGNDGNLDAFDEDVINMNRLCLLSFILGTVKGCMNFIASFNESNLNSLIETIQSLTSFFYNREVYSKSVKIMAEFVESVRLNAPQEFASEFTSGYAVNLIVDTFRIVTDPCYNFAFNEICDLFIQLLSLPLINENASEIASALHEELFSQFEETALLELVTSLIQSIEERLIFRQVLRDFLIDIKKVRKDDEYFLRDEIENEKFELQQQIQNEVLMNAVEVE